MNCLRRWLEFKREFERLLFPVHSARSSTSVTLYPHPLATELCLMGTVLRWQSSCERVVVGGGSDTKQSEHRWDR